MAGMTTSAPFTRAVVSAMRRLYPEDLADESFDNTGLLLEAPFDATRRQKNSVLLTIDLTKAVADEAIARRDSIVVAYHPIIFRGLKSLTLKDTQQQSLLRLAAEGISVYSPHTAVDCASGGLGDWLADIVTGTPREPVKDRMQNVEDEASATAKLLPTKASFAGKVPPYVLHHHSSRLEADKGRLLLGNEKHRRCPIQSTKVEGHPGAGMGRVVRFSDPVSLPDILDRIHLGLGSLKGFQVAVPQGKQASDVMIGSIGICAGSGGHLFAEMEKAGENVDLLFTGELSHHEALAAIEKGRCVICLLHSNTERGFLHSVLKHQLERTVQEEWARLRTENVQDGHSKGHEDALNDDSMDVHVSEVDRDPYGIMFAKSETAD